MDLGFICAWLTGGLAAGFAIPAGLGDIVAAAGSLGCFGAKRRAAGFCCGNVIDLANLIAAIVFGARYSDGAIGVLRPMRQLRT